MSSLDELLTSLRNKGVQLSLHDRRLDFDAPAGALTPSEIDELRVHKDAIVKFLHEAADSRRLPTVSRQRRDTGAPLSHAQQRMWFLEQLGLATAAYNVSVPLRLKGSLNTSALQASFTHIVQRHEILRTRFVAGEGQGRQIVDETGDVSIELMDLGELTPGERDRQAAQLLEQAAVRPFDLRQGPLLRTMLLRLSDQDHVLLITLHHIVTDEWSAEILLRELAELYNAHVDERRADLPELPIQYADFAIWQRRWLEGARLQEQFDYWRQQLAGLPETLQLPMSRQRPAVASHAGALHQFALAADVVAALTELGQRHGATVYMVLLTAFQVALSRWSGQTDIAVGSPVAERGDEHTTDLIGNFLNSVVLRANTSGDPRFTEFLQQVRATVLDALSHQAIPFDMLVQELQPERNLSRHPLFQVAFVLNTRSGQHPAWQGLALEPMSLAHRTAKFDLTLGFVVTPQEVYGQFEFATDLFDAATISRMADQLQCLLGAIAEHPDARLSQLALSSEAERDEVLRQWNDTAVSLGRQRCLQDYFAENVRRTPQAVALRSEERTLTYEALDRESNRLAHYLRASGVLRGQVVGLCTQRSMRSLIGFLGILKAGAAYLPLDAHSPAERLGFMLDDARAVLALSTEPLTLAGCRAPILQWAEIAGALETQPEDPLDPGVGTSDVAYVLYTSGSTGEPKGVMVSHGALSNHVCWLQGHFALDASDRVLLKTAFSFDASITELCWPLFAGVTLVLARPKAEQDPQSLAQFMRKHEVTVLQLVPSLLKALVKEPEFSRCTQLRRVLCGAEVLTPHLQEQLHRVLPAVTLHNVYGPTEATVDAAVWDCRDDLTMATVPIGRAVWNTQLYVLDEQLDPVPVGVSGELYVGGVGLAYGYIHRAGMTAERFLANPFGVAGSRLYRTGDRARWNARGQLEYQGRIDYQVKVRGFRIELGEIEAALLEQRGLRDAVVIAREDAEGHRQLVAYLVASGEAVPNLAELRAHLKTRLPEYMLPAAFVWLDSLPLNRSGKVDRKALPAPDGGRPEFEQEYVAPRTPMEQRIAGIWSEVLKIERIGVHDNFFELGGDSIQSLQVVARANQAGLKLTVRQIFVEQTIAGLAAVAGTAPSRRGEQGCVEGPVPLTPIQHWFFEGVTAEPHHFNQSLEGATAEPHHFNQSLEGVTAEPHHFNHSLEGVTAELHHFNQSFVLSCRQRLQPELLTSAMHLLLAHHDALRLRFRRTPEGWQQWHATPEERLFGFESIDLSHEPAGNQEVAMLAVARRLQRSLDLEHGPLVQAALFDYGMSQHQRLLLIVHHLAVDGVSWRILLEDLHTAYEQLSVGQVPRLPDKTSSFQQWAQRLSSYAQSSQAAVELKYWQNLSRSNIAPLPRDHADGVNTVASTRNYTDGVNSVASTRNHADGVNTVASTRNYTDGVNSVASTRNHADGVNTVAPTRNYTDGVNTVASTRHIQVSLSEEDTERLLQEVPAAYHTQINDVLLTALVESLASWRGERTLLLALEGHGREELFDDIDLSRTVGWFTSLFPVVLDVRGTSDDGESIQAVKEQLRAIPNRGVGYGILRYLRGSQELGRLAQPELSFNYLGRLGAGADGGIFQFTSQDTGPSRSDAGLRRHLIEIDALISSGRLVVNWLYSEAIHNSHTIQMMAQRYMEKLRSLIEHCAAGEGGYTPSDLALTEGQASRVTQSELNQAIAAVGGPRRIADIYPLSPLQEGIVFHDMLSAASNAYVTTLCWRLTGDWNIELFSRAWQEIVQRHDILRTAFVAQAAETPLQVVLREVELPIACHDWRDLSNQAQAARMDELIEQEPGFQLHRPPLMRLQLVRTAPQEHRLIWSHHHVILDGWSIRNIVDELSKIYAALSRGERASLPRPQPYRSFIAWLHTRSRRDSAAYWRSQLADIDAPTPLGIDVPAGDSPAPGNSLSELRWTFATAVDALEQFLRSQRLTASTLMHGLWAILLSRYSDSRTVVFGTTASGRPPELPDVESRVGLFINTVPCVVRLDPAAAFATWIGELHRQQLQLLEHQHSSLVDIQAYSAVPPGTALFESLLVFQNYARPHDLEHGAQVELRMTRTVERSHFPLVLQMGLDATLVLNVIYDTGRFERQTIEQLAMHLETLLEQIIEQPDRPLRSLSLLSEAQRRQLKEWNVTAA